MRDRTLFIFRAILTALAVAVGGRTQAQLASNSPFLPPQNTNAAAPTQNAPLEYRGYIETPSGALYRLYDPAKKGGSWVKLNEKNADFGVLAKTYDSARKTLTIEHDGRTLTLEERVSKIVSSGPATQMMMAPQVMPGPGMPPAIAQSAGVLNPTQADEQKRLEAVAAEVARRRALREQASNQINQGVAPQVTVPQPPPRAAPQGQGSQPVNSRRGGPNNRQQR